MLSSITALVARTKHPKRNALAMAGFIALIVAVMCWWLIVSPRLGTATQIQSEAEGVELANISQQRKLADLSRMADEAPQAALRVQRLLSRMPQKADLPELFAQITRAALDAGISENNISAISQSVPIPLADPSLSAVGPVADALASAAQSRADVAKLDVTVSVTATDDQILAFTGNLENLERDFLLSGISISNPSGQPGGERVGTITGTTFLLQSTLPDLVANVEDVIDRAAQPAQDQPAQDQTAG